jgi:Subtilisin-like serine proteases
MESTSDNQSLDEIQEANLLSHNESLRPIIGILLAITVILATGYLIALVIEENPFGIRPTSEALEAQSVYQELVQIDEVGGDGTGVKVCIVDSGIDTSHPDLSGVNLVAWRDFVGSQTSPYDDQGHGTSMAGILVGDGYIEGVAPNVELVVAKALSENGSGEDSIVAEQSIGVLTKCTNNLIITRWSTG